jgi:hypothetical protein
MSQNFNMAEHA